MSENKPSAGEPRIEDMRIKNAMTNDPQDHQSLTSMTPPVILLLVISAKKISNSLSNGALATTFRRTVAFEGLRDELRDHGRDPSARLPGPGLSVAIKRRLANDTTSQQQRRPLQMIPWLLAAAAILLPSASSCSQQSPTEGAPSLLGFTEDGAAILDPQWPARSRQATNHSGPLTTRHKRTGSNPTKQRDPFPTMARCLDRTRNYQWPPRSGRRTLSAPSHRRHGCRARWHST